MTDPIALAQLRHLYQNMVNGAVRDTASAKRMAEGLLALAIEVLERDTSSAMVVELTEAEVRKQDDELIRQLVEALEVVASGNTDPDAMVELARATLTKCEGVK